MQAVNTFTKGMNLDIDKSMVGKDQYLYAENFRLFTESGNTSGSLENITGNTQLTDHLNLSSDFRVCGYATIRDELYLFMTRNNESITGQTSIIVKYIFNSTSTDIQSAEIIYTDDNASDSGRLNFNTQYRIKAVGRYESDDIKKLYWVDGHNNMRFANVGKSILGQAVNKFDIIPNFALSTPQFIEFASGTLKAGRIQYAYQMYDKNGGETLFSPASGMISVSEKSGMVGSNKTFKGSEKDVNTGKGIRFSIQPPKGFDRIRIVSIFYDELNTIPTINIIADQYTSTNPGVITFFDNGSDYVGQYTYEEFAIVGNTVFVASEIETKDDYLFVGNISQTDWDIDYDARAYRFLSSTHPNSSYRRTSILKNSTTDDTTGDIWINGAYPSGSGGYTAWNAIPEDHNCINYFNDITQPDTDTRRFKYKADGTTLGGEGLNVSYTFVTEDFLTTGSKFIISNTKGDFNEDYSYNTDYSNVTLDITKLGYQRDEIYRFGVVFYNDKGQVSTTKWIGDIRFPSVQDGSIYSPAYVVNSNGYENAIFARPLGIRFAIKTKTAYNQGARYFRVVRAKREANDRTILAQGLTSAVARYDIEAKTFYGQYYKPTYTTSGIDSIQLRTDVVEFVSPEVNFNKNLETKDGDRLDRVGCLTGLQKADNGQILGSYLKYTTTIKYHNILADTTKENRSVTRGSLVNYNITSIAGGMSSIFDKYGVDIDQNYKFINLSARSRTKTSNIGMGGTKMILTLSSGFTTTGIPVENTVAAPLICNYRRPIINSQYGGPTYQSRQNTSYIACSDVVKCDPLLLTTQTQNTVVYRGDTYISMYDYLRTIVNQDQTLTDMEHLVVYFPVETSINLRYRHDNCFSKEENRNIYGNMTFLMTESAGKYQSSTADANAYQYEQKTDLYLYNSVYSQEDTTIKYFPKNDLITNNTKNFDSRILASDKKINGELSDSWTKFKMDNFIDVDSTFGKLTNLKNYRNILYFWQPKGFGAVSVNPRSVLQDNNPGQLVLGTGGVLDRYDYISNVSGCKYRYSVVAGLNGLYWLDSYNNGVYRYSGKEEGLSKMKGINTIFKDINDLSLPDSNSCYDKKNNEVLFKITYKGTVGMLSYNELFDCFNGIYTFNTDWFIQTNNTNYITTSDNKLYIHNIGDKSKFYEVVKNSKVSFIVSDNYPITKTFDKFDYHSTSTNGVGVNVLTDTFKTVRVYNDHQNSNYQDIVMNTNLIRKERGFELAVPRNRVDIASSGNPDIFDPSNLDDETRTFKERMRDRYIIVDLVYYNNTNYNFNVPYITTNYRISKR